jgi:uncharacterized phage-associated protein
MSPVQRTPQFREDKATQAAALLLRWNDGTMNYMKLMKLLYFAERRFLLAHGRPITFDSYVSMDNGPVLSATLDKIKGARKPDAESYWQQHISAPRQYHVSLRADPGEDALSPAEIQALRDIFAEFGALSEWALVRYSHQHFPEWKDPAGSSKRIAIRDILTLGGGMPDDVAASVEQDLAAEARATSLFC